jgi:hypothetical protein
VATKEWPKREDIHPPETVEKWNGEREREDYIEP